MTKRTHRTLRGRMAGAASLALALCLGAPALANPDEALNQFYSLQADDPLGAIRVLEAAEARYPDDQRIAVELGFALLKQERQSEALPRFERAVAREPERADLWKQLGYVRKALRRPAEALAAFERVTALNPADEEAQMEQGYLLQELGRNRAAARAFRTIGGSSNDAARAREACRAWETLYPAPDVDHDGRAYSEIYAAPEYNSHFDMGVLPVQARIGSALDDANRMEVYTGLRINADTQSGRGAFGPQTFTDNSAVLAAGFRVRPVDGAPLSFFVESGVAYDLTDRGRDRRRGDLRGGAVFYDDWNMAPPCGAVRGGVRPVADLYADAIYYSRYDDNVLFYARARPGLRLLESDDFALDAYALGAVNSDSRGQDENRFVELGAGAALRLFRAGGLTLRAEGVQVYRSGSLADYSTARIRVEYFSRLGLRPRK